MKGVLYEHVGKEGTSDMLIIRDRHGGMCKKDQTGPLWLGNAKQGKNVGY